MRSPSWEMPTDIAGSAEMSQKAFLEESWRLLRMVHSLQSPCLLQESFLRHQGSLPDVESELGVMETTKNGLFNFSCSECATSFERTWRTSAGRM